MVIARPISQATIVKQEEKTKRLEMIVGTIKEWVNNEIKFSSEDLIGANADVVMQKMQDAKFQKIEVIRNKVTKLGILHTDGEVYEVTIKGAGFQKGETVKKSDQVTIYAYSLSENADLNRILIVAVLIISSAFIIIALFVKKKKFTISAIVSVVVVIFVASLIVFIPEVSDNIINITKNSYEMTLQVTSDKNTIFSKYDVIVKVDDEGNTVIANGMTEKIELFLTEGEHKISVYNKENLNLFGEAAFSVSEEADTILFEIKKENDKIEIAEAARQNSESISNSSENIQK